MTSLSSLQQPNNTSSPSPAVDLRNITFCYQGAPQPVLKINNWQISRGSHVFVEGASGSGKSTLLNLLTGTLQPQSGTISLLGTAFSSLSMRKKDQFRARNIGVVFQQFNLIPYLSVAQNIEAATYFANRRKQFSIDTVSTLLESLQLPSALLHQKASALSVGQQQRVAIARALINQPQLMIVDEPTSALDANARDKFMQLLLATSTDSTLIFVSHDTSLAKYFSHHYTMETLNSARSEVC